MTTVYVLSICEWREGGEVVAVGADLSDAMRHADLPEHLSDPTAVSWGRWQPDPVPEGARFTCWIRDAITQAGETHHSRYQQIVAVPFVGAWPSVAVGHGSYVAGPPVTEPVWRAFIGQWGDDDWPTTTNQAGLTWEQAQAALRDRLTPYLTDTCEDCQFTGTEALARLNTLTPGAYFDAEVDGDDYCLRPDTTPAAT